eukprot:3729046-Rhodomonas_salina.1
MPSSPPSCCCSTATPLFRTGQRTAHPWAASIDPAQIKTPSSALPVALPPPLVPPLLLQLIPAQNTFSLGGRKERRKTGKRREKTDAQQKQKQKTAHLRIIYSSRLRPGSTIHHLSSGNPVARA